MTSDPLERFALPPPWPESLLARIRAHNEAAGLRIVVLDDDPMAGQAIHGVPVLTRWNETALADELRESAAFCLLTNSRSRGEAEAVRLAAETGEQLRLAGERSGNEIVVVARGDSTLRGHFPAETEALVAAMDGEETKRCCLFVPYFGDGGRYTLNDTQYVAQGGELVPVGETEFARDPQFAFTSSHLPAWLEERTRGRVRATDVVCVSLDEIRRGGPDTVAKRLLAAADGATIVANAAADGDLEVVALAAIEAERAGKRFTYRSAAPFVRVRAGIARRPLLSAAEVTQSRDSARGGLVIVGSYVERTTAQLDALLAEPDVDGIELQVDALLSGEAGVAADEVEACAADAAAALAEGRNVAVYTTRGRSDEPVAAERIGRALAAVVDRIEAPPRFLIVKGGATACDIALGSLRVRRAEILGQLLPGVPAWRLGPESRFGGAGYVIFPGNVGESEDLLRAVRLLDGGAGQAPA